MRIGRTRTSGNAKPGFMSNHRTYDALYDAAEKHGRWLEIVAAKSSIVMLRVSDKDGLRAQERVAGVTGLDVAAAKLLPLER